MGFKGWTFGFLAIGGMLVLSLPALQEKADAKKTSSETKPLVRKDLLDLGGEDVSRPLRNIFRPKPSPAAPAVPRPRVAPPPVVKPPQDEPPEFVLDLKYIGSVQSGGKTMALVIRSGQAVPVAEGEEVIPGYRVVRITPQEIEVEGPDARRKTFARQGDR